MNTDEETKDLTVKRAERRDPVLWDPWGRDLFHEMDRMFDDMRARMGLGPTRRFQLGQSGPVNLAADGVRLAHVEVRDEDSEVIVTAELPGLERDQITLEVKDETLRISGGDTTRVDDEAAGTHYRSQRRFFRAVRLPAMVRADDAKARLSNGVLEVTLPKAEVRPPGIAIAVE